MKNLRIGVAELLTEPSSMSGDTRCFSNVVTWASSEGEYTETVRAVSDKYGWQLLGVKNIRQIEEQAAYQEEIEEIIERARHNPRACIYSTFHYYPSAPA